MTAKLTLGTDQQTDGESDQHTHGEVELAFAG